MKHLRARSLSGVRTIIVVLIIAVVLLVPTALFNIDTANALTNTEWQTVAASIDAFIQSQYVSTDDGEAGFLITGPALKSRMDTNNDGVMLGEGDDAANAPVLVDVLNTWGEWIPGTSLRIPSANAANQTYASQVATKVYGHRNAGFNDEIVIYCGTGHVENPIVMGYGAMSHAGYFGTPMPRVVGVTWGRMGWGTIAASWNPVYSSARQYTNSAIATPSNSLPTFPTANCTGTTPNTELVRCAAQQALAPTSNGLQPSTWVDANYQPVDIRSTTDYYLATTAGAAYAYQDPLQTLFNPTGGTYDNLKKLTPGTSKAIVFYSRTQHSGLLAAEGAQMLGYNAKSLRFGLPYWNGFSPPGWQEKWTVNPGYTFNYTGSPDVASPIISNIDTGAPSATGATIVWNTNEPATSFVEYGTTPGGPYITINDTVLHASHSVTLSGLSEHTTYYYRVTSYDGLANYASNPELSFQTADVTPPIVSNVTPAGWVASSGATITADLADAGSGINTATASISLDGGAPLGGCTPTTTFVSCPATGLGQGAHTIAVSVSDLAGNAGVGSGSFDVDSIGPAISNLLPNGTETSQSLTLSADIMDATGNPNSGIDIQKSEIFLDGSVTALSNCTKTTTSINCPVTASIGAHTFSVTAADYAGNSVSNNTGAFVVVEPNYDYYFPWYDNNPSNGIENDWIMINNEGALPAQVKIFIGGIKDGDMPADTLTINAGESVAWSSPITRTGGPVRISSIGQPLLVSQRVIFKNSFNELMAVSSAELDDTYYFTWYDKKSPEMNGDWIMIANTGKTAADVRIKIGGKEMINPVDGSTTFNVPVSSVIMPQFPEVMGGPVEVACVNCTTGTNIVVSQRVVYKDSFNEITGSQGSKLADEALFTWYDNNILRGFSHDWILVSNTGSSASDIQIYIGGTANPAVDISIDAGESLHWQSFLPRTNGPIRVVSTNGEPLIASQRVIYKDSFNEVQGAYISDLGSGAHFNWYDNMSAGIGGDWILVGNTGSAVNMGITIGNISSGSPNIRAGATTPGIFSTKGGPVEVKCNNCGGRKFVISQRFLYKDSFDELLGKPAN
ncbi:MAG: fibronectin type III domain-containing protein [Thermoleophilia bacterium]